jgi:hypothetical protein
MNLRRTACQQALQLTQQMLEAARQERWNDLPSLQASREAVLKVLEDPGQPASDDEESGCLRQMLDADPELRSLVQVRRSELSRILNDRQVGRSMSRAYAQVSGTDGLL